MESNFSDMQIKETTNHAALDQVVKVQRLKRHTYVSNFNKNCIQIDAGQSIEPNDINCKQSQRLQTHFFPNKPRRTSPLSCYRCREPSKTAADAKVHTYPSTTSPFHQGWNLRPFIFQAAFLLFDIIQVKVVNNRIKFVLVKTTFEIIQKMKIRYNI